MIEDTTEGTEIDKEEALKKLTETLKRGGFDGDVESVLKEALNKRGSEGDEHSMDDPEVVKMREALKKAGVDEEGAKKMIEDTTEGTEIDKEEALKKLTETLKRVGFDDD